MRSGRRGFTVDARHQREAEGLGRLATVAVAHDDLDFVSTGLVRIGAPGHETAHLVDRHASRRFPKRKANIFRPARIFRRARRSERSRWHPGGAVEKR